VIIIGYNFAFLTSFPSNKPEQIDFFVDELIKHAHNPIKNGHKAQRLRQKFWRWVSPGRIMAFI